MVLRKQAPLRLDRPVHSESPPETAVQDSVSSSLSSSPALSSLTSSPFATVSAPASSPRRLVRAPRPRSPSRATDTSLLQEEVFSPDLNTSPAFDLMPLEEAQRSPVASSMAMDSHQNNPWEDELVERPDSSFHEVLPHELAEAQSQLDGSPESRVPPSVVSGTHRRMAADAAETDHAQTLWDEGQQQAPPVQLRSNNPFLKSKMSETNPWESDATGNDSLSQGEGYIPMTARLSLLDQPAPESPWAEEHSRLSVSTSEPAPVGSAGGTSNASMPVYLVDSSEASWNTQAPEAPLFPTRMNGGNTQQNQQTGMSPPRMENTTYSVHPVSGSSLQASFGFDDQDLPEDLEDSRARQVKVDTNGDPSRHPITGSNNLPPSLPARPRLADTSEVQPSSPPSLQQPSTPVANEDTSFQEQQSETYSIRHITWTDPTGQLRESPVLIQARNGPCPLLALVNSLVLRAPTNPQLPIVKALQPRENISLSLLIQALFDELTTRLGPHDELPDIEALSQFLTMLHLGLNVNPRLTLESDDAVGTFFPTRDIRLYGTFGVPLVHGWIASPYSEAYPAMERTSQYHEDIQLLHFRRDELEDRVVSGGSLTSTEEQQMRDIQAIERFITKENATQLSTFGLTKLTENLVPGSISIFFRNNHFSTLYKHPDSQQLFTLVTDAGYSNHAEVVWESLVDVNGFSTEYFAGDFRLVGQASTTQVSNSAEPRTSSHQGSAQLSTPAVDQDGATDLSSQEQSDADYAYALSLQFEEEERRGQGQNPQIQSQRGSNPPQRSAQLPSGSTHQLSSTSARGRSSRLSQSHYSSRALQAAAPNSPGQNADVPPPYEQITTTSDGRGPPQSNLESDRTTTPSTASSPSQDQRRRSQLHRQPPSNPARQDASQHARSRSKECAMM